MESSALVSLENFATGRYLDSNDNGTFTLESNGGSYQKWKK
jgi:hypothetical protein